MRGVAFPTKSDIRQIKAFRAVSLGTKISNNENVPRNGTAGGAVLRSFERYS
jgi:hypothetical protein